MFSTNKNGIEQISLLLTYFKFRHTIQGLINKPNREPYYILQLSRKDQVRFLGKIKPISKLPKLK